VRNANGGSTLTIPARRPIKPVYIRALVDLAARASEKKKEEE
jgi:hypothetical protein